MSTNFEFATFEKEEKTMSQVYSPTGSAMAKKGFEVLKEDLARKFEKEEAISRTKTLFRDKKKKGYDRTLAMHVNKLSLLRETWDEVPTKYHSDLKAKGFNPADHLIKVSDTSTYSDYEKKLLRQINNRNWKEAQKSQNGGEGKPAVVLARYTGDGPFQLDNGAETFPSVDPSTVGVDVGCSEEEGEDVDEEYIKSVIGPEADWVDFFDDYVDCQMGSC